VKITNPKKTVIVKAHCAACLSFLPNGMASSLCPRCRKHYAKG
jgi:hypothetical protein